ncbi:MAG TPA: aminotransferase class I/II-fold pyridoxal phosphate-dependent enzyme [Thermoplasmata archaeon]|nr:aminotransferase class I/II-fold pyridoxal phosphate-dependent enzyme [Thermoplasmata archaeon]
MNWLDEANFVRMQARLNNEMFGSFIPLIASENVESPLCQEMLLTDFHGRYAEGTPDMRYYQGCKYFDEVEKKAMELAKRLFNCSYANVQTLSGTVANMAMFKSLTKPGGKLLALDTAAGGHISAGKYGAAGFRGLAIITFPFDEEKWNIDVDKSVKLIETERPNLTLAGGSVILFPIPLKEIAEATKAIDSYMAFDGAHVLGLIGGKHFQDPLHEGAQVMTASTHKTFPGPQGGIVLANPDLDTEEGKKFARRLDFGCFPGVTSNYHLHHVAAKAVVLAEHLEFGEAYAKQTIANAKAFAQALWERGFQVLCEPYGFTESHQVLLRIGKPNEGKGKWASEKLEDGGLITNQEILPGDKSPTFTSGLRLGTQELTRIGMKEKDMEDVAEFMKQVLLDKKNPAKVKEKIKEFRKDFQFIHYCFHADEWKAYEYRKLI